MSQIYAVYNGNASLAQTSSNFVAEQVLAKLATTTTLGAPSVNPALPGQPIAFTAIVAAASNGVGTPTGSVDFYMINPCNGPDILLGAVDLTPDPAVSGRAEASFTASSTQNFLTYASYMGDQTFAAGVSLQDNVAVAKAATTTNLSASLSTAVVGQAVTFSATVTTANAAAGVPTGLVQFWDLDQAPGTSTLLATLPLDVNGKVSCTTTSLAPNGNLVKAVYLGNSVLAGSWTLVPESVVNVPPTLTASASPAPPGAPITFTAAFASTAPTGTMAFYEVGITSPDILLDTEPLVAGQATSAALVFYQTCQVYAVYSGDSVFPNVASARLTVTVAPAVSTVALTSSASPAYAETSVTFTATVSTASVAAGAPGGTVSFCQAGGSNPDILLGTATLLGSGTQTSQATFSTAGLAVGTEAIYASYSGSSVLLPSVSADISQQIITSPVPILSASPNPALVGQSIAVSAALPAPASGPGAGVTPTGTVSFSTTSSGATTVLGSALLVNGQAGLTTSIVNPGPVTITATYSGDGVFPASSSSIVETANQSTTSISLATSSASVVQGAALTLTAQVGTTDPLGRRPQGQVTFYKIPAEGPPVALGLAQRVDTQQTATLSVSLVGVGVQTFDAVYDDLGVVFAGSTSPNVTVTVLQPTATTLTSSANPAAYGNSLTLTAVVSQSPVDTTVPAPTGSVTFFNGQTNLGVANLNQGTAAFTGVLGPGPHSISCVYSGDGANAPSTSDTMAQSIDSLVTVTADVPNAAENGTSGPQPGDFTFTRVGPTTAPLTVNYTLADSAINGTDYEPLAESVVIPAGAATAQLPLFPLSDGLVNAVRQQIVVSAGATGTYTLTVGGATTAPLSAAAMAADLEAALTALTPIGTAPIGRGNCEVSGAGTANEPFIVAFTAGLFEGAPPTITADNSQLAGGTVAVTTLAPIGANLQATLQLAAVAGVYDVAAPADAASVTIADPEPHIQVHQGGALLTNGGTVDFGATTFSNDVNEVFTITSDGNVPLVIDPTSLVLPPGYELVGTLPTQIAAGSSATVTIALDANSAIGSFAGTVSFVTNDSFDGNPFQFSVTGTVLPDVTIAATAPNAAENATGGPNPGDYTVARTGPTDAPLTVDYTLAGSAVNGTDYAPLGGSVVFPAGSATVNIPLTPLDDGLVNLVRQQIVVPTGAAGTFTLSVGGATTTAISTTATAADVQVALTALATVGAGNCVVSGGATTDQPFIVAFTGALFAGAPPPITADSSQLAGGPVAVTTLAAMPPNLTAILQLQPSPGIYAVDSSQSSAIVTIADPEPHLEVAQGTTPLANSLATIDFGSVFAGQTASQSITVASDGNVPLMLSSLVLPTGFQLVGSLPGPIAPGSSATLTIELNTGDSLGTFNGIVSFSTNDSFDGAPFQFNVTGQVLPWTPQDVTIADFGLVNDTGISSTDRWTSDPRMQGVVNGLFTGQYAGSVVVEFQASTDGVQFHDDGATAQVTAAGTSFIFDPRAADPALAGYLGPLHLRYQIVAYDLQGDSVPGGWNDFPTITLVPVEVGAYIADFGLANDTGLAGGGAPTNPPTTYDPRVQGTVKGTFLGASVDVQFADSTSGQTAGPNTVPNGYVTDVTTSPTGFIYDPTVADPSLVGYSGPLEIDYRTVERDGHGNAIATSPWMPFTMLLYLPTPRVSVTGFQLVDDTDPASLSLATADPRAMGTATGDLTHGGAVVEFSHHGDGVVEGSVAVTQTNPTFTYDPRTTEPALDSYLGTLDLKYRTVQSDANGGKVRGAWTAFPFTLEEAPSPATITALQLTDVTQGAGPPPVTSNPTVSAQVTGATSPGATVEFEYNSDIVPDASVTTLPNGSFQLPLPNLPYGPVTEQARQMQQGKCRHPSFGE